MVESEDKGVREKRGVDRKYLVFYLRVFDGMSTNVLGHVINISSRGIMLLSDSTIPLNEEYRLRMRLPKEVCERGELIFNATSRCCKKDANPDFYITGFQISDLSSSDRNDIFILLDEFGF